MLVSIGPLVLSFDAAESSRADMPTSCSDVTPECIRRKVHSAFWHSGIRPRVNIPFVERPFPRPDLAMSRIPSTDNCRDNGDVNYAIFILLHRLHVFALTVLRTRARETRLKSLPVISFSLRCEIYVYAYMSKFYLYRIPNIIACNNSTYLI